MGRNIKKVFTQGISFEIFSKDSCVGNPELDTLTLPCITHFGNTCNKRIKR